MPPQRSIPKQKTLLFDPIATPIRQTPRTNRTIVPNYSQLVRVDEPIENPLKEQPPPQQLKADEDVEMDDGVQDDELDNVSLSLSEEEIGLADTPTRKNLPTTVVIRTRHKEKKQRRKTRTKKTWVQAYFDVTTMEDEWINPALKHGEPIKNRLWTCKLCGPAFTSTNKERHSNTSRLNNHMRNDHDMTKEKHLLKQPPKAKKNLPVQGGMDQFVRAVSPIPSPEEASLKFFAMTNQPFELVEHKSFKNIYRSIGLICLIGSAGTLAQREGTRFNDTRKALKVQIDKTCTSFSISFDGWGADNHKHILGVIAYWITEDWERRSIVIEFAKLLFGKSGKAMADLI
jgi:hypothetical protein